MEEQTFDAHLGRAVTIDTCFSCQAFWFDARESISLTPGATLSLFRMMGDRLGTAGVANAVGQGRPSSRRSGAQADTARCPRCRVPLRRTSDMQRATRFEYWRCPQDHGRLTTFFDFLREKNFIKPLTPPQVAELRRNVRAVNCSSCGAAVDVTTGAACAHCASPLSMLDLAQAGRLIAQLQNADARGRQPIDPTLPLQLARARRDAEAAFSSEAPVSTWLRDAPGGDLLGATLIAIAKWLRRDA
jgi:hypothetical protein